MGNSRSPLAQTSERTSIQIGRRADAQLKRHRQAPVLCRLLLAGGVLKTEVVELELLTLAQLAELMRLKGDEQRLARGHIQSGARRCRVRHRRKLSRALRGSA